MVASSSAADPAPFPASVSIPVGFPRPRQVGLDLRAGPRAAESFLCRVAGADVEARVRLPREAWTVTVARNLASVVLADASETALSAVQIAISEACANAVIHADPAKDYQVRIRTGPDWCQVQVIDAGKGFDLASAPIMPAVTAASGRGLVLISAVVDRFEVRRRRPTGAVVRFATRLR